MCDDVKESFMILPEKKNMIPSSRLLKFIYNNFIILYIYTYTYIYIYFHVTCLAFIEDALVVALVG